jgi:hypothetical protein
MAVQNCAQAGTDALFPELANNLGDETMDRSTVASGKSSAIDQLLSIAERGARFWS